MISRIISKFTQYCKERIMFRKNNSGADDIALELEQLKRALTEFTTMHVEELSDEQLQHMLEIAKSGRSK